MGIALDVGELACSLGRDEPEIGTCCTLLCRHRTGLEVTVLAARRHHCDLEVVDHLVELVEFGPHGVSSPDFRIRLVPAVVLPRAATEVTTNSG